MVILESFIAFSNVTLLTVYLGAYKISLFFESHDTTFYLCSSSSFLKNTNYKKFLKSNKV